MKLLKVLATGVVALAVSTSVMAGPLQKHENLELIKGALGCMVDAGNIVVAPGLTMAIEEDGAIKTGRFSNIATTMGPFGKVRDGAKSSTFSLMQSYQASGNAADIPTDMAANVCQAIPGAGGEDSFLPSIYQLKRIHANKTRLLIAFKNHQAGPFSFFYKISSTPIITAITDAIKADVEATGLEVISSTEVDGDATSVRTLKSDGTEGTALKTDTDSNFICVSKYKPANVNTNSGL